ncbi:glycosyltransferase [Massilia hydrophila]|uniref:glycosyltransferase n=1 Tax=Massilia hydrophila TaxID=3044279 RepID=UPI003F74563C
MYVGFGSMAGFDRAALLRAVKEAVGPRRALFYPGWSGIDAASLPSNFFVLGDTPHDWLFPRCALIVHHGGAGTAHAAARSGTPSVVIPFAGDQFFWARRMEALGIGAACTDAARLNGARLGALFERAAAPAVRGHVLAVAAHMRSEDGVAAACTRLAGGVAARLRS